MIETMTTSLEAKPAVLTIEEKVEKGWIEECAACGKLSAYSWDDAEEHEAEGVAHIGTACCYSWECGHCRATNVERDSPTLAECYTHIDWDAMEESY